tara:strand:- start:136 stop:456 length:321 start_codon:yes stop_codon:yes gene_type:complete
MDTHNTFLCPCLLCRADRQWEDDEIAEAEYTALLETFIVPVLIAISSASKKRNPGCKKSPIALMCLLGCSLAKSASVLDRLNHQGSKETSDAFMLKAWAESLTAED